MRLLLLRTNIVKVICKDERKSNLRGELEELLIQPLLLWKSMVLHLKVETLLAEDFAITSSKISRMLPVIHLKCARNLAVQATGKSDQPLRVLRQVIKVDARLVIHAVEVRIRYKATKVAIAGRVGGEQDKMEGLLIGLPLLIRHATTRNVGLHADDRFNAALHRRLHELHRSVEGAVVGNRNGVHAERLRLVHERIYLAHAVEQAEFGVDVEMGEIRRLAHGGSLPIA